MSLVAVYASIEICEAKENDIYHLKLNSMLHPCPCCDVLIVSGDFNTVTGTERAGYEVCVGTNGSFWYQEQQQLFPSESYKIQKVENCRILVQVTLSYATLFYTFSI